MPSGQHANGSAEPEKLNPAPPAVKFMPAHWPKGLVIPGAEGSSAFAGSSLAFSLAFSLASSLAFSLAFSLASSFLLTGGFAAAP